MSELIDELLGDASERMSRTVEATNQEFASVRTGRASPAILDRVTVDYYGAETPLNQLATINAPEARLITVQPFDVSSLPAIEKAIMEADLGLTPGNDGKIIRLAIPELSEERRKELVKVARAKGEDCRVVIRKARHECKDMIDTLEKDGEIGGDEADRGKKDMEDITKAGNTRVDEIVAAKEKDILEV